MTEHTIVCPKCGGRVAFPDEIAGQAANCPHCQQAIILGKNKRPLLWALLAFAFLTCLLLCSVLFWQISRSRSYQAKAVESASPEAEVKTNQIEPSPARLSEDDVAIETLCRLFYELGNQRDFAGMHRMLTSGCKEAVTPQTIEHNWGRGISCKLVAMDSISYSDGPNGKLARARVRRSALSSAGQAIEVREFKCIKESTGWKLFRDLDWIVNILSEFQKSGMTDELKNNIRVFCAANPFEQYPTRETEAFEQMYEVLYPAVKEVFPWNVSFTVQTNFVDGMMLKLVYSVRNTGSFAWRNFGLKLELKQGTKGVLSDFDLLGEVASEQEINRESTFLLHDYLGQTARFDLDVSYQLSGERCIIAANVPVTFKVQDLSECVRFEVVQKSFETTKSTTENFIWVARLDYRLSNIGREPVKDMSLRFVWSSLNGEIIDQTIEFISTSFDVPLLPRQRKSGFVHCGKGYTSHREPVLVDIYMEQRGKKWLLSKGLVIQ